MDRKDGPGQPGSWNLQAQQDHPYQDGVGGVQQDVDRMIPDGMVAKYPPLEPPQAPCQWVIISRFRGKPKPIKSVMRPHQPVNDDERAIIKDEPAAQGRQVRDKREPHQQFGQREPIGACARLLHLGLPTFQHSSTESIRRRSV